jgi:hypothetical protein
MASTHQHVGLICNPPLGPSTSCTEPGPIISCTPSGGGIAVKYTCIHATTKKEYDDLGIPFPVPVPDPDTPKPSPEPKKKKTWYQWFWDLLSAFFARLFGR